MPSQCFASSQELMWLGMGLRGSLQGGSPRCLAKPGRCWGSCLWQRALHGHHLEIKQPKAPRGWPRAVLAVGVKVMFV